MSPSALVRPDLRYMASFVEALREGYQRDSLRPETPEAIAAIAAEPEAFVRQQLNPPTTIVLPDGSLGERVPETHLWRVEGDAFLGSVGVRHRLNAVLEAWGGHIGYAVRPSAQGRGLATGMLAEALGWCRANLPLDRVMLTVNTKNIASTRVIEKNGGVLLDTIPHPWIEGDFGRRYWIDL
ncbi:GNAT family N-acetyltransferase [Phenylobacterium sp. J367]|uniref:GNAT family N-acetyltransferase n=1 Tax=Phenylobacterium sp. J367 TaxID=2898435 RepID=UPI0021510D53|nr:GNAT family N-acetyltransferase [Phenylobacterium sp. J367]MCR5879022.1 GNAT family N-acetyltransferase [Phenylobacterium sp. J367]